MEDQRGETPESQMKSCRASSDDALSLVAIQAPTPTWSAEDVQRRLAEKELPAGRGGLLVWAWVVAVPVLWAAAVVAVLNAEWPVFFMWLLALLTGRTVSRLSLDNAHRRAAILLPDLDQSWLGALVESLVFGSSNARSIARLRLTTVLPTLDSRDGSRLTDTQRALLFDQLTPANAAAQPDLVTEVLRYAADSGDHFAVEGAGQLARMRAWTRAQRRVRQAARSILPRLEAAIAQHAAKSASVPSAARPAEQQQADLTPEKRAWLDQAEDEPKKQPGMRFAFLLAVWAIIVPFGLYQTISAFQRGDWFAVLAAGVFTAFTTQAHRLTLTPQQTRVAARLASIDDVQAVGYLAEMTTWPDDRIKAMALSALTRLLPRMKSTDTHLLSASQRTLLYQMLHLSKARKQAEFLEALLKALEQVGDTAAIPCVRGLADSEPASLRQSSVVKAARECLPYLEGCAQQNRDSQILLRPTASDAQENLLRPAAQSSSPHELLVRVAPRAPES
jgi:hypothetical protein